MIYIYQAFAIVAVFISYFFVFWLGCQLGDQMRFDAGIKYEKERRELEELES